MAPTDGAAATRKGLRIFVGTANLGNALPDPDSLDAWLPQHGKVHHVLHSKVESSSIVEGVSKRNWSNVDAHGKIEIIALGTQESIHKQNILTSTGLTAKLTGTTVKARNAFTTALGELGKPIDELQTKMDGLIASTKGAKDAQAELGGTKKLKDMLVGHIGDDYELMTQYQRGEILLYLFVRKDLASMATVTEVLAENCGIGSVMANKGGIATTLTVGSTRISFLTAHLAAHEGKEFYEQRNANIEEILQGTNDPTISAHHVFVFGDLNYRFSLPLPPYGTEIPKEETLLACQTLIAQKDWGAMNKHDELNRALREKDILVGFQTPPIRFFPTFKCKREAGFHYNEQRTPSYTDRILWKSIEETPRDIEALIYEPIPEFSTSDHKPVRGLFFLPNRPSLKMDPAKTALLVRFTNLRCSSLRPAPNLLTDEVDVHTYLRLRCEPSSLEKNADASNKRTSRTKFLEPPVWPREELRLQINIISKEEIHGARAYIQCMNQNVLAGDSLLGTIVVDLEHIVRKSLGVEGWTESLDCNFLRNGKEVGKMLCSMTVAWDKGQRSHSEPSKSLPVPRTSASIELEKAKRFVKSVTGS